MSQDILKKVKSIILNEARTKYGARKQPITISPKQWEAINAGAISTSALRDIITDISSDVLKTMAMPKSPKVSLSSKDVLMIKSLSNRGYTNMQIAKKLGISPSTVSNAIK